MTPAEMEALPVLSIWYLSHAVVAGILYVIIFGESPFVGMKKLLTGQEIGSEKFRAWHDKQLQSTMQPVRQRVEHPDDYWDGEVNYETGEISTDSGTRIRHPKNRDRAYSGSVERFHDGGW